MINKFFMIILSIMQTYSLFAYAGSEHNDEIFDSEVYPFCFNYGGLPSALLLANIEPQIRIKEKNGSLVSVEKEWRCKDSLVVTLCTKYYLDYSATEWNVYITFNGEHESKIITDLYGIDSSFVIQRDKDLIIHTNKGDDCTKYSYQPYNIRLNPGQIEVFYPTEGGSPSAKSTTGSRGWPYWNIQNGNRGWIIAVGWPGTWQNEISRDCYDSFRVRAGQKTFGAILKSGETIRTPLICILPWEALDIETSQNIWRHFYIDHIIPRFNGEPEQPATEIQCSLNEKSIPNVQKYIDAGIKPRICWKDAGWYPTNTGSWQETGEWKLDPKKYPNGIKPFTVWAKHQGIESLLWFEPERVRGENTLNREHQDWLLSIPSHKTQYLNLGNPEALSWLVNHIDKMITDGGLDWYREDLNEIGPYKAWLHEDSKSAENRQGITENLYVQGHLRFWDTLKQRHPGLHIDACASGGRRNDIETMHRAVPLLRSDYQWAKMGEDYILGNQAHTWALSSWLPYQGSNVYEIDPYKFRSFYLPCFGMGGLKDENAAAIIQGYTECVQIQAMMVYGDYWPLTSYSLESNEWIAWQFNREDEGNGCIQAFRRETCEKDQITLRLRGIDATAYYKIRNFDSKKIKMISGKKLLKDGIEVRIMEKPGSAIFVYERIQKF